MGRGVNRCLALGIALFFWISVNPLFSQSPQKFSYQELVRDAGNIILLNQAVGMRVSILQGSAAGASVYSETHSVTTNENGLASIEVGAGTPVSGVFSSIAWGSGPFFVKSEIDPAGGTAYSLTNTTQLLSVPYTLYAKTLNFNNLTNKPTFDGSETKVISGTTITASGTGTSATPYVMTYVTHSVTQAQRNAIATPYTGQFVWCNNCGFTGELQIYSGSSWLTMCGATATPVLPVVTTTAISAITSSSASGGGNVTSDGGGTVSARGVCWSTSTSPTTADSKTSDGTGPGVFVSSLTGLNPVTTYYVRAYVTNGAGTTYGNEVSFTTPATTPTLTTTAISALGSTTVTSGGNITADGGAAVTARGVCWSTSPNPTTAGSKTTDGSGTGSFVSSVTGLTSGATYYLRAYATNGIGTAYGNEVSFTTLSLATLTTTAISAITSSTSSSGGTISNDGGSSVTARGVCWSIYANPTLADEFTSDGSGSGAFASSITSLYPLTVYYVRAYATNSAGTAYGNQLTFTTLGLAIGDPYQGGIIAHLDGSGGGLITTPADLSTGVVWGCQGTIITADKTAVGFGDDNTNEIVSVCTTSGIAADICYDLVSGGYSDWSLPAQSELNMLYNNRVAIGGFTTGNYWTSSEYSFSPADHAYYKSFFSGNNDFHLKIMPFYVRPVREIIHVGKAHQDGIVVYIYAPGDAGYVSGETHGLIAATSDNGFGIVWGCSGTNVSGGEGTALGTGNQNTLDIEAGCITAGIAADICAAYNSGNYSDWYLPSRDELAKMYLNKSVLGGIGATNYWSSSETSSTQAYALNFTGTVNIPVAQNKTSGYRVRAISSF